MLVGKDRGENKMGKYYRKLQKGIKLSEYLDTKGITDLYKAKKIEYLMKVLGDVELPEDILEVYMKFYDGGIISEYDVIYEDETAIPEHEVSAQRKKLIARVEELFELEPVHSAWALYNSMNYVFNHERGRSLESRYNSVWFESGKRLDKQALKACFRPLFL